jgi:cytochrome c peroxidase
MCDWKAALVLVLAAGCSEAGEQLPSADELTPDALDSSAIQPIPQTVDLDARRVALGDQLFHERRLSADDTLSCSSCHDLHTGGVDGLRSSIGIRGQVGPINAPTVFNSGLHFRQFWDGRALTLEDQVNGPTHAPGEMGSSWEQILGKLGADPDYVASFAAIYPDGITAANVRDAIATFERSLITPDSAFDRYLRGEASALSEDARRGYRMFTEYGCASCHQGVGMGGNMFQRFGVMGDYFADRGNVTDTDMGRFNVTHRDEDRHVFRVPSLRNIARTAPYFHDGSAPDLARAVRTMAHYQLGRELDDGEVVALVAFLESLTGRYRGAPL